MRAAFAGGMLATLVPASPAGQAAAVKSFEVTASRFKFEPSVLEVEEGDVVRLTLHSADGTHGFGIKELKVKARIPKGGQTVTLEFPAPGPGTYLIACSEYCGSGHRDMKGRLVVAPRK